MICHSFAAQEDQSASLRDSSNIKMFWRPLAAEPVEVAPPAIDPHHAGYAEGRDAAMSEMRSTVEAMSAACRQISELRRELEAEYRKASIEWVAKIVNGIAPVLAASAIHSEIDALAVRLATGVIHAPVEIEASTALTEKIRGLLGDFAIEPHCRLVENPDADGHSVRVKWSEGGLSFNTAETINLIISLLNEKLNGASSMEHLK